MGGDDLLGNRIGITVQTGRINDRGARKTLCFGTVRVGVLEVIGMLTYLHADQLVAQVLFSDHRGAVVQPRDCKDQQKGDA